MGGVPTWCKRAILTADDLGIMQACDYMVYYGDTRSLDRL